MSRPKSLSGSFESLSRRLRSGAFSSVPPRPKFAHPPARPNFPAVFVSGRRPAVHEPPRLGRAAPAIYRHLTVHRPKIGSISRAFDQRQVLLRLRSLVKR